MSKSHKANQDSRHRGRPVTSVDEEAYQFIQKTSMKRYQLDLKQITMPEITQIVSQNGTNF